MLVSWGNVVGLAVLAIIEVFFFWILSRTNLALFLFLSYVVVPSFLLLFVSGIVSGERKSRFTDVLFSAPLSSSTYLLLRVGMGVAVAAMYFLLVLPFTGLILYYGGFGWLSTLLEYWLLFLFYSLAMVAIGLLISVAVGSRGVRISSFASLGLIVLFLFSPFAASPQVSGAFPRDGYEIYVRLLHFSPVFNAFGYSDMNEWVVPRDASSLLVVLGGLSAAYFSLSALTLGKLQTPSGWTSGGRNKLFFLLLLMLSSTFVPLVLAPDSQTREPGGGMGFVRISPTLSLHSQLELTADGYLAVHETYPANLTLFFDNSGSEDATLSGVEVELFGDVSFNPPRASVGEVSVPGCLGEACGYNLTSTIGVRIPLEFRVTRISTLDRWNARAGYVVTISADQFGGTIGDDLGRVEPRGYNQYYPVVAVLVIITVLSYRPIRRSLKR